MSKQEKIEELREKYHVHLRDGEPQKADNFYWKIQELKGEVEETSESESEQATEEALENLDGVGPELAEELREEFGSLTGLKEAEPEDLEEVPGIGEARARSLIEQVSE